MFLVVLLDTYHAQQLTIFVQTVEGCMYFQGFWGQLAICLHQLKSRIHMNTWMATGV